jgi:hypothetical protein
MAELTINWETLSKVPQPEKAPKAGPVITSEGQSAPVADEPAPADAPAAQSGSDKPYFIYVTDGSVTVATGIDTVEKVILDDDRVKLGSHAFHAVKMTPDDAKTDPLLADKGGKEVPRIIFVTGDLKTVKPLEGGSLKLGEVWASMKATSNKFYKQDLDALVKELKSVLIEFDKINNERKVLDEKEKREAGKGTAADVKDMAAKRADLDTREKKATERKTALWELKAKAA